MSDEVRRIDLDTNNLCFFCATKDRVPHGELEDGEIYLFKRAELTKFKKILQLEFTSVISQTILKPTVDKTEPEITALLCPDCFQGITDAVTSHELIKEHQLRLMGSFELIHDKVQSLNLSEAKKQVWQKTILGSPKSVIFYPFMEELKNALSVQAHKASKRLKDEFSKQQVNLQGGNNDGGNEEEFVMDDSGENVAQSREIGGEIHSLSSPPLSRDDMMGEDESNNGRNENFEEFQARTPSSQPAFPGRSNAAVSAATAANTPPETSSGTIVPNLTGRSESRAPEGNPSNVENLNSSGNSNGNKSSLRRSDTTEPSTKRVRFAPSPPPFRAPSLVVRRKEESANGGRRQPTNDPENGKGPSEVTTRNPQRARRGKNPGKASRPYDRPSDNN